VGIVQGANALVDQQAFLLFDKVEYMADIQGATEVLVYGADRDDAAELGRAVQAAFPEYAAQAWSDPWAGLLTIAAVVQTILTGIIIFITALGVWNTMMMSVLERTGEIGVMRAMGLGRLGAVVLFVVEAVAIAVFGGGVGVGIGALGGARLERYGVQLGDQIVQNSTFPIASRIYGDLNAEVVLSAFALGLLMAFFGSAVPALRAASIQPISAMRTRG
jgi:putative ABC transport system permease protein